MSMLLAGTADGIYRSDNSGASWEGPLPGTGNKAVISILALSDTAFIAGCSRTGMLVSSDRGMKWREMFAGHSVSSLVKQSDGGVCGISDGTKIIRTIAPYSFVDESGIAAPGRLPVLSLTVDGAILLAGTADGVYSYSNTASTWKRLINGSFIGGIAKLKDNTLYYFSQSEGLFIAGDDVESWVRIDRRYKSPVSSMCLRTNGTIILGNIDGTIVVSKFHRSEEEFREATQVTNRNATLLLGIPAELSGHRLFAIGLCLEIRPYPFVSAETMLLFGLQLPFKVRLKVYPGLLTGLFAGAGYFHYDGYMGQGGGMTPDYYYPRMGGQEFFVGYRFPKAVSFEIGWRYSTQIWRVRNVYSESILIGKVNERANEVYGIWTVDIGDFRGNP